MVTTDPVHNGVGGGFERYLLHGEGIAEDVLAELFAFGAVFWWHGTAGVNVEAGMFPGLHAGNQFWGDEFVGEQFLENAVAKEFGQNAVRDLRCELEDAVGIEQTVGDPCVNTRMKIEVFAIGVEGENKGRNTFGEIEGELEGLGDGFLSEGRDAPEKSAVALKEGTKQLGQGQNEVAVWDGEENVINEVCGGGLDLALMAGWAEPSTFAGES